ncbi:uncharacterized protein [Onthophagus taurus]|uniref:uncharacterized protein isoform X2 n=1 Tax=Onthophagus taurus TaxID=166361 RepID=UPI0039BE5496
MQYKNNSKPTSTKCCLYDNWKPWAQKVQGKNQENNRFWGIVEAPYKYWERKPRSNLPKPFFDGQNNFQQTRQRLVLKNRLGSEQNESKIVPVQSKRSIPNHALMKNLLSGLSIFDDEKLPATQSSIYRHKSLGNLKEFTPKNYEIKPSVKSSIDFTESSQLRRDFNEEDFRKYCRNYAKVSLHNHLIETPENYFAPKTCTDKRCPFNHHNKNVGDGCFFKKHSKFFGDESKLTYCLHKRNIVQERKRFFERKEKDMQEECRLSKYKPPLQFFSTNLPVEMKTPCYNNESVMELYRNAKIVGSATTISRSKHSRMKLNQHLEPKQIELFHPDYNFDNKSSSGDFRQSIIDSIRTKIFKSPSSFSEEDDYFDSHSNKFPKFPKETRKAMSIIMNKQKKNCRCCKTKQCFNVETQTSPVSSKNSVCYYKGLPCTKNLLCKRGYHNGRCEEEIVISRKLESICSGDCCCKRDQHSSEVLRSSFWSIRSRIHSSIRNPAINDDYINYQTDYDSSVEENVENPVHYE